MSQRILPLVLAGAAAAVLAGCAVVNPTAATPTATPTPTARPSKTVPIVTEPADGPDGPAASASATGTTAPPTTLAPAASPDATQLQPSLRAYYAAADQVLQAGGAGAPTAAMADTMTGAALDSWTTKAADYRAKGYRQSGATRVESFSPGDFDAAAGTASVDFCANADDVRVTDAAGTVVPPTDPAKLALGGTANLVFSGGRWRVASLAGLTPIPACP